MTKPNPEASWPTKPEDFEKDMGSEREESERRDLLTLAVGLTEDRPVPSPALRSAIRESLRGRAGSSRSRVAALVFGYATSGTLLLAIAAVGLAGIGPFAA